jgi:hypothetical protein
MKVKHKIFFMIKKNNLKSKGNRKILVKYLTGQMLIFVLTKVVSQINKKSTSHLTEKQRQNQAISGGNIHYSQPIWIEHLLLGMSNKQDGPGAFSTEL